VSGYAHILLSVVSVIKGAGTNLKVGGHISGTKTQKKNLLL